MGKRHALHFLERVPRAQLVAAFSPDPEEISWAREHLAPSDVKLYTSYEEMLQHAELEAVVIATITAVHAEEACIAIDKGLHVLCEKPLGTTVDVVSSNLSPSVKAKV
jgi:predicted dehydrogenase